MAGCGARVQVGLRGLLISLFWAKAVVVSCLAAVETELVVKSVSMLFFQHMGFSPP